MLGIVALSTITLSTVSAASSGLGTMLDQAAGDAGYDTTGKDTALINTAGRIAGGFISLIGIIFISYTIYGGFLWMTAAGREEQITKAKSIIRDGIIGIIVILGAAAIFYFVFNALNQGASSGTANGGGAVPL